MFRSSFRLPLKLLGVPIRIDTSFLLVLPLFAWMIGSQLGSYGPLFELIGIDIALDAYTSGVTPYLLGLVAALGLFGSVLVHELGHALVARRYGVEVEEITLWFLGGLASFRRMPKQRGAEAVVAIAGPLTSLALALLAALALNLRLGPGALLLVYAYLASANAFLALFNLLPALPLDGGRILRSLLALGMPQLRATRVTANVSRVLALLLGVAGFLSVNVFLLVIAFFVYGAVRAETSWALLEEALGPLTTAELMTPDVIAVDPGMPLEQLAKLVFYQPHHGYPVTDPEHRLLGFVRVSNLNEEGGRPQGAVADILEPAESIGAERPALEALERLGDSAQGRLVVLDRDQRVVGIVSRSDLLRSLRRLGTTSGRFSGSD